jgi:hypothetical protein
VFWSWCIFGAGRTSVEIRVSWDAAILTKQRWEEIIYEAVLGNEVVQYVPEHLCPDRTNGVLEGFIGESLK